MVPLAYGCIVLEHRTIETALFSIVLSQEPLGAIISKNSRALEEYCLLSPVQVKLVALEHLKVLRKMASHGSQNA